MNGTSVIEVLPASAVASANRRGGTGVTSNPAARWVALFVTGFGTFVNLYVPQPILPYFRHVFAATELQASLTVSATVLAVALAAPWVGLVADAVGRKRIIVAAMLGLSLPTALCATAADLNQLIAWRFAQGLFIPGIIAVALAYISEESPRGQAGKAMAIYVTGTVVGGFVGRFATGLIAPHWGWRAAFLWLGLATCLGGLATWCWLPRSTRFVPHREAGGQLALLGHHLHNGQLLATYAVGFNVLFSLVGVFTYVNFYLADKPFSLNAAALSSIFGVYLIGAVFTPVAGWLLDRIGYRRALIWATLLAAVGATLTLIHWVPVVILGLAGCACGAFACQSAASSQVGKAAGRARSSAAGLYVAFYYLGGCVGSVVPGLLWRQAGWPGCVALMVLMQGLSAAIAFRQWRE